MTTRFFTDHILGPDTHTNRPAASDVPDGALYECTTHNQIDRNNAGTWGTWAVLGGSFTDPTTTKGDLIVRSSSAPSRLAIGADGTSLVADAAQILGAKWENRVKALVAGTNVTIDATDPLNPIINATGGGGAAWDHPVNALPLTTLTGWTAGAGTWTAGAGGIRQADTSGAGHRLRYTTARFPQGELVAEVDIKVTTLTQGVNSRAGFLLNYPFGSDTTNSILACLRGNAGNTAIASVYFEYEGIAAGPDFPLGATIAPGATTTFRVYKVGTDVTVWVNGTCIATAHINQSGNLDASTFAFYSWGTDVTFSNLDVWTPTLP